MIDVAVNFKVPTSKKRVLLLRGLTLLIIVTADRINPLSAFYINWLYYYMTLVYLLYDPCTTPAVCAALSGQ